IGCSGSGLRSSRVFESAAHLCSSRAGKRLVLSSERFESLRVELFEIEQGVVRALGRTDELIELDLNGFGVAVLCVLNQEHHQECHDRRSGIDDQLPRVAELEEWSGDCPDHNDKAGQDERPWSAGEVRRSLRELRVPGSVSHVEYLSVPLETPGPQYAAGVSASRNRTARQPRSIS